MSTDAVKELLEYDHTAMMELQLALYVFQEAVRTLVCHNISVFTLKLPCEMSATVDLCKVECVQICIFLRSSTFR